MIRAPSVMMRDMACQSLPGKLVSSAAWAYGQALVRGLSLGLIFWGGLSNRS